MHGITLGIVNCIYFNMSFYKGTVAKLVCFKNDDIWNIVDMFEFDSNNDSNMNIEFHHNNFIRAAFIPVTYIEKFNLDSTKIVKRHFNFDNGLESWEAV